MQLRASHRLLLVYQAKVLGRFSTLVVNLKAVTGPVSDLYGFSPIVLQLLPPVYLTPPPLPPSQPHLFVQMLFV